MADDEGRIRAIETRAIRAWQAPEELEYDGWLLRFAGGYTRRANSVNPVRVSTLPLGDKIAHCEAVYAGRSLPSVFRLHPAVEADLDAALDRLGYRRDAETAVLVHDPTSLAADDEDRAFGEAISASVTEEWLHTIARCNGIAEADQRSLRRILRGIEPDAAYIVVYLDGAPIAVGLGVVDDGWVGIFDVAVDPAHRRRGVGTRVVRHLMRWGAGHGATAAYLQVSAANRPALALYRGLGFTEAYRYWYRMPPAK